MMAGIREWLSQIVCFLCLMRVLLHVIPDTGLKKYVQFFLGILFLLVLLEPLGRLLGTESFLANFELENLRGLQQDLTTGTLGLGEVLPDWDEEAYQRELEEKIEKIYQSYHIPREELHTNNQETGVEDGEIGTYRQMEETEKGSDTDRDTGGSFASGDRTAP